MVSPDVEGDLLLRVVKPVDEAEEGGQEGRFVPDEQRQLDRRLIRWDGKSPVDWRLEGGHGYISQYRRCN